MIGILGNVNFKSSCSSNTPVLSFFCVVNIFYRDKTCASSTLNTVSSGKFIDERIEFRWP